MRWRTYWKVLSKLLERVMLILVMFFLNILVRGSGFFFVSIYEIYSEVRVFLFIIVFKYGGIF